MCERCVSKEQLFTCLLEKVSDPTVVIEWDEDYDAWVIEGTSVTFDFISEHGRQIFVSTTEGDGITLHDPKRQVWFMLEKRRRERENAQERKTISAICKALKGK